MLNKFLIPYNPRLSPEIKQAFRKDHEAADTFFLYLLLGHWVASFTLTAFSNGVYLFGLIAGGITFGVAFISWKFMRGTVYCRSVMGIALMVFSAIFIQQHMGRIEFHFHIFAALAMLMRYKDIVPMLAATLTTAVHHILFNYCQMIDVTIMDTPVMVFNYGSGWDIVLLHVVFVVLEIGVLFYIGAGNIEKFSADSSVISTLNQVSLQRDLTRRVELVDQNSEVFNRFLEQMETVLCSFAGHSVILKQKAANVLDLAKRLATSPDQIKSQTNSIASASEQMSNAINSIAASSAQASHSMTNLNQTVTENSKQINTLSNTIGTVSDSLNEVATKAQNARDIGEKANVSATETIKGMRDLHESSQKINNVVKLINDIAGQTRMLALNATIEAASAGESGKGFAVVASEVKNLAHQTSEATHEIEQQIQQVRGSIQNVSQQTQNVGEILHELVQLNQSVAESVQSENQKAQNASVSIEKIAEGMRLSTSNVNEATVGLNSIAKSIHDAAMGIREIHQNSEQLSQIVTTMADSMQQSNETAESVHQIAAQLQESLTQFTLRSGHTPGATQPRVSGPKRPALPALIR